MSKKRPSSNGNHVFGPVKVSDSVTVVNQKDKPAVVPKPPPAPSPKAGPMAKSEGKGASR